MLPNIVIIALIRSSVKTYIMFLNTEIVLMRYKYCHCYSGIPIVKFINLIEMQGQQDKILD